MSSKGRCDFQISTLDVTSLPWGEAVEEGAVVVLVVAGEDELLRGEGDAGAQGLGRG